MIYTKNCGDCSCYDNLVLVNFDFCTTLEELQTKVIAARNKCIKQEETGSFGYCRVQERKVAYYCKKCKADGLTTITTKVRDCSCSGSRYNSIFSLQAPGVVGRFIKQRLRRNIGRV